MDEKNKECCPEFDVKKWDEKTFNWNNKFFLKESIPTLFHIPFPPMIGQKITKMFGLAEKANKNELNKQDSLVLFHDPSAFKSEIFLSVTDEVPEAQNTKISGTFEAKVFDGGYNAVPKFIKQMDEYLAKKQKKAKDYYIHYAFCPGCAKKYQHNYMILFAEV